MLIGLALALALIGLGGAAIITTPPRVVER